MRSGHCKHVNIVDCLHPTIPKSNLCGTDRIPQDPTRTTHRWTIALTMMFNSSHVRPLFANKPTTAYTRELHRVANFLASARAVNTTMPITVLVGGKRFPKYESWLVETYPEVTLRPLEPLAVPPWASQWHRHSFMRWSMLSLTEFDAIVHIDNDSQLFQNIDHIQHIDRIPAAVWHPGSRTSPPSLNGGFLVFRPNATDLSRFSQYVVRSTPPTSPINDGSDQQILSTIGWEWSQLPLAYNTHRALCLSTTDWHRVRNAHIINGYDYKRQSPEWFDRHIRTFWTR